MKKQKVVLAGAALAGGLWLRKATRQPISLQDQVVIVTGASSGIGRAAVHAFAAQGARVVLVGRRTHLLQEAQAELEPYGVPTLVVTADATRDEDLENLVAETRRTFGRIDVLVNNAGRGDSGALDELDAQRLHAVLQTNLHGTFRLTQLVLPTMLEQGSGHIVFVSSLAAHVHVPGVSIYAATKSAIVTFANCLRREVSGQGIHVSCVLPGIAKTEMTANLINGHFAAEDGEQSGAMAFFLQMIDEPDALAQDIVDAVRYRKREVLSGGLPILLAMALERTAPGLLDWLYSQVDATLFTSIAGKLGA